MSEPHGADQPAGAAERKAENWRLTRRGFLLGIGFTGAGLALGIRYGIPTARLAIASVLGGASGPPGGAAESPMAWFEIAGDESVRFFVPKSEMGQGVHTALAQIAAEELEVPWDRLQVVQAGTGQGLDGQTLTGASNTISTLYQPVREAAATLREMLRAAAATQLGVAVDRLVARDGTVEVRDDATRRRTYGELVQAVDTWEVPRKAPALKPRSEFRFVGKAVDRVDLPAKVTGAAVFGYDARLPGMAYGAVAHPPTVAGKLRNAQRGTADRLPGVVAVVIREGFAGVVAESRQQAYAGVRALELDWDRGPLVDQTDIEAATTVGVGRGVIIQKHGRPRRELARGEVIRGEYRTPLAAHAHLEPQAALVDASGEQVRAWVSTQDSSTVRRALAARLGREPESVQVTPTYLGGGFGRKLDTEAATEAAVLSAAVRRPVHVGWDRTEDMRNGYFRPPTHHVLRGKLDGDGRIVALEHQQASAEVAFPFLPRIVSVVMGADFGAYRGAAIPYAVPHRGATAWLGELPVRTGWWRGLGLLANVYAAESFIDELAAAAQVDPLQMRLQHLGSDATGRRFARTLRTAAERSGWGRVPAAGRARGIACSIDVGTVVAMVAEVSVDQRSRQIQVHRMTAAVDPGMVINPDGATAQIEGNIVMGLSSTLHEQITIRQGQVEAANFDRYPLLSMRDTPEIEVVLLESGDRPFGMGEPPIGPVAAAVGNAVWQLTGERLRRLPLRLG